MYKLKNVRLKILFTPKNDTVLLIYGAFAEK